MKTRPRIAFHFLFSICILFPSQAYAKGLISTADEVRIGKQVREQILQEYQLSSSQEDINLVRTLGNALVKFAEKRSGINYEFEVLDSKEINAFAAPGGYIFITTGLLDFTERDPAMVAGVIAHEIGHVARKHHRDVIQQQILISFGLSFMFKNLSKDKAWLKDAVNIGIFLVQQGHSREREYEADRQAVLYTYRAGWNPEEGYIKFLALMEEKMGGKNPLGDIGRCIASHPDTDRRKMFAQSYLERLRVMESFTPREYPEEIKLQVKSSASDVITQ